DAFLAVCARGDEARAREMLAVDPGLVARLQEGDPAMFARFAGAGNTRAVRLMLDLGFDITARAQPPGSPDGTALHIAVWRERAETVRLLIERGAPLEARSRSDDTPLSLAIRALTELSEWTPHASTNLVAALLAAGAQVEAVRRFPTGSAEADELLRRYGKKE